MGSAPTSDSFESRLGSSARRGAYVRPGMTGVYRVTRSRTTQAQSLRRARVNPNAWIQPDDMVLQRTLSKVGSQFHDAYFDDADVLFTNDPGSPLSVSPDYVPEAGKLADGGPFRWMCSVPFWNVGSLAADALFEPDMGDWPSGATGFEYENPEGVLVTGSCHVVGTARWSRTVDLSWSFGITVRRYPRLGYDFSGSNPTLPGDNSYHEPETNPDLALLYNSGDVVGSLAALAHAATEDFDWPLDDPDAEGWTALFVLPDSSFGTVLAGSGGYADETIHAVDLSNNLATNPYIEAMFTPPRYRFTF